MKNKYAIICICLITNTLGLFSQIPNPDFDSLLAKSLGADERGMKKYVMVILKTGTNNIKDKVLRDSLFKGHFKNIGLMADLGKLVVAGPLEENDKYYRGIFILNVTTFEDATELLKNDPTISKKIFDVEMFKWYGSAALQENGKVYKKIQKYKN